MAGQFVLCKADGTPYTREELSNIKADQRFADLTGWERGIARSPEPVSEDRQRMVRELIDLFVGWPKETLMKALLAPPDEMWKAAMEDDDVKLARIVAVFREIRSEIAGQAPPMPAGETESPRRSGRLVEIIPPTAEELRPYEEAHRQRYLEDREKRIALARETGELDLNPGYPSYSRREVEIRGHVYDMWSNCPDYGARDYGITREFDRLELAAWQADQEGNVEEANRLYAEAAALAEEHAWMFEFIHAPQYQVVYSRPYFGEERTWDGQQWHQILGPLRVIRVCRLMTTAS